MNASGSFVVGLSVRDGFGHMAYSNVSLVVPVGGSPPGGPSGLDAVSAWTWAVLGAVGVLGLAVLAVWGFNRRRRPSDELDPAEESATESSGPS
jgi:hypothetical protein